MCDKDGGMRFKYFRAFSMALLVKLGWRIISDDESTLVHKIYKAKYFSKTSFMELKLGHSPSFAWK